MEKVKSRMECRKYKKSNAITLIALIITIIIMLILLAVTISILVKSNIIGIAESAADKTKTAYEKESNLSEITIDGEKYGSIDDYTDSITSMPEIKAGERAARTSKYIDGGKTAIIPKGFTVSAIKSDTADETTIEGGLVIYDIPEADLKDSTKVDWTNPDTVKTNYNQFVWIPVEVNKTVEPVDTTTNIASFRRSYWENSNDGGKRKEDIPNDGTDYCTEPYAYDDSDYDGANGTGIASQISELKESIYNYGGFYIGRYEAGVDGNTARSESNKPQDATFVIQQDKYPYNYVMWGADMDDISTGGAVYLSNNLYPSDNSNYGAISMLCTGACWDAVLDFVKDSSHNVISSSSWGNFEDSEEYNVYRGSYAKAVYGIIGQFEGPVLGNFNLVDKTNGTAVADWILLTTGATERNSSKNIYDFAGNCFEWTTESSWLYSRVLRGGGYLDYCYADSRWGNYPSDYYLNPFDCSSDVGLISFRPILFIK